MKAIGHNTTSLRMTVSKDNTFEEMDKIVKVIKNAVEIIKRKDKTVTKG
jgi:cysteine sulfinate desulfinase/cysteine desulfurase-like protein